MSPRSLQTARHRRHALVWGLLLAGFYGTAHLPPAQTASIRWVRLADPGTAANLASALVAGPGSGSAPGAGVSKVGR